MRVRSLVAVSAMAIAVAGSAIVEGAGGAWSATAAVSASPAVGASSVTLTCAYSRYGAADEPAEGVLPAEYDRDNYKLTSLRDPAFAASPQNHCGRKGAAVDLAWGVTKGRDDVLIAVLDSGIR